jgi:FHS family L-fucose permease-like MFS transporter
LNFGNALGAVAFIIAPMIAMLIVPSSVNSVSNKIPYLTGIFVFIGVVLLVTVFLTFLVKEVKIIDENAGNSAQLKFEGRPFWKNPQVILGFIAIFLVLGTEGGIFSFYQVYLKEANAALSVTDKEWFIRYLWLDPSHYQLMFTVFFAIYAIGRLLAGYIQRKVEPVVTLLVSLSFALVIIISFVFFTTGIVSIILITGLGLFISILFPTIYSIAIKGLGENTSKASGLLTMGFLGSTVIPVIQGQLADHYSLQKSFSLPIIAYLLVIMYTIYSMMKGKMEKKFV